MALRILIADDHGVLRAGLRARLNAEPDMEVVGEAADGPTALQKACELLPDVILLDINMPGPNGIEITRQVKRAVPEARILILTVHEDEALFRQALRMGAAGYIIKRALEAELISAIHTVAEGELYVHPAMAGYLLKDLTPHTPPPPGREQLSPRETEVLCLLAQGHTNLQVADKLGLSVRTVENYRANLVSKLRLRNRAELVRFAKEHKLI